MDVGFVEFFEWYGVFVSAVFWVKEVILPISFFVAIMYDIFGENHRTTGIQFLG